MSMTTSDDTTVYKNICCIYRDHSVSYRRSCSVRILKGRRLSEKFLMCYTFGNFYIINIVFTLQLMHISNVFTLCLVTALLSVLIGCRVNRISPKALIIKKWGSLPKTAPGNHGSKRSNLQNRKKIDGVR